VICPFHRHEFDLVTGRGNPAQHDFIHIYPIKKEEKAYYVGIEKGFWRSFLGSKSN